MRKNRYIYLSGKDRYFSFTDIAAEFGVGKGVVAGKFYRAGKKGKSTISINKTRITRRRVTIAPIPWYNK